MVAVRGKYDGTTVTLDRAPLIHECEVIVTFLDPHSSIKSSDNGSLAFLFRDYVDDGIREPIIDFGEAIGNEKW